MRIEAELGFLTLTWPKSVPKVVVSLALSLVFLGYVCDCEHLGEWFGGWRLVSEWRFADFVKLLRSPVFGITLATGRRQTLCPRILPCCFHRSGLEVGYLDPWKRINSACVLVEVSL